MRARRTIRCAPPARALALAAIAGLAAAALASCAAEKREAPAPPPAPSRAAAQLDYVELGVGGAAGADAPLVIAVHGLGDRPENLAGLYRDLARPCRLVLPRGPLPYGDGSSWFDIDIPYAPDAALGARIAGAADRVAALIAHLGRARPGGRKPVVTGFSQGGMISFALAVRHPGLIAAAVPIAGALPEAALPEEPIAGKKPVIRAFHGAADRLVPIDYARRTVAALVAAGYDATLAEHMGAGHEIQPSMRRAALAAIEAAIAE